MVENMVRIDVDAEVVAVVKDVTKDWPLDGCIAVISRRRLAHVAYVI